MVSLSRLQTRELINAALERVNGDCHTDAVKFLHDAIARARQEQFEDEEMQALLTLSACFYVLDKSKVRPTLERAAQLARNLNDKISEAKCHLNLSAITSDHLEAIRELRIAFSLFERSNDQLGSAQALDNISVHLRQLGLLKQACLYVSQARSRFLSLRMPSEYARCLQVSADLMTDIAKAGIGDSKTLRLARTDYNNAMYILSAIGASVACAICEDSLGLLDRQEGNPEQAAVHHENALRILTRVRAPYQHSSALLHLASAWQAVARYSDALRLYPGIIELKLLLDDHDGVINARFNRAVCLVRLGEYDKAVPEILAVLAFRYGEMRSVHYPQASSGVLSEYAAAWSLLTEARIALMQRPARREEVIGLIATLEQGKFNAVDRDIGLVTRGDEGLDHRRLRDLKREMSLRHRIRSASLRKRRLKFRVDTHTVTQQQSDEATDTLIVQAFQSTLRLQKIYEERPRRTPSDFKSYLSSIEAAVYTSLNSVLRSRNKGQVLLYLSDNRERQTIFAAIITGNSAQIASAQIQNERWSDILNDYNEILQSKPSLKWERRLSSISVSLGDILDRLKVSGMLDGRPVLLFATSFLQSLPWQIAAIGSGYLGTRCNLTLGVSLGRKPVYDADVVDEAMHSAPVAHLYAPSAADLPASVREVDLIRSLLARSSFDAKPFMNNDASKMNIMAHSLTTNLDVLHFAGHSEFDDIDAGFSRLIFGGSARDWKKNWLTAMELEGQRSACGPKLVYLSSCKSGRVEMRPGDEFIGLAKAFLSLGSKAFVCTTWANLDSSAADLSVAFYKAALKGCTVAEAARLARRRVLKMAAEGKYPEKGSFIHWGPMISMGHPSAAIA